MSYTYLCAFVRPLPVCTTVQQFNWNGAIDTQDRNAGHKGMTHSGCSSFSSVFLESALILTFLLSVTLLILEVPHSNRIKVMVKMCLAGGKIPHVTRAT